MCACGCVISTLTRMCVRTCGCVINKRIMSLTRIFIIYMIIKSSNDCFHMKYELFQVT